MANFNRLANPVKAVKYFREAPVRPNPDSKKAYLRMKRAMDVVGSFIGLAVCLPLFAVISILIKLEDPKGSILFKQIRIGKDGRVFQMYKFRSMVSNAENMIGDLLSKNEISGAMFKMKDDPRMTKIGKIIRKWSLDELPQLWNVLKNDMSLVGPRPSLPREVDQYTAYDKQRLLVMPGCTGLWQISGRNSLSFSEMVELDLQYINNRSIRMDTVILLKTVLVLVSPSNAY